MAFLSFLFFMVSSFAQIQGPSQKMSELLLRSGINSFGKRETLAAQVGCKELNKKGFHCFVIPLVFPDEPSPVATEYFLEDALEISLLLTSFEISPIGNKKNQLTDVTCRLSKTIPKIYQCEVFKGPDFDTVD